VSIVAGVILGAMWSGLALRRPSLSGDRRLTGMELLLAPRVRLLRAVFALVVLPVVILTVLDQAERLDWEFVMQKVLLVCECTLAFGLILRVCADVRERPWSAWRLVAPPIIALASLYGIPRATAALGIIRSD